MLSIIKREKTLLNFITLLIPNITIYLYTYTIQYICASEYALFTILNSIYKNYCCQKSENCSCYWMDFLFSVLIWFKYSFMTSYFLFYSFINDNCVFFHLPRQCYYRAWSACAMDAAVAKGIERPLSRSLLHRSDKEEMGDKAARWDWSGRQSSMSHSAFE